MVVGASGRYWFGTSSWSEPSWSGVFYPPGTPPAGQLPHYATIFRTVEADVTYYRVPSQSMVSGWRQRTPDGFRLAAKFPRSIVHGGDGPKPDADRLLVPEHTGEDLASFLDTMALLGDRCGPLVLQFPYFSRQAFAGPQPFLERLDACLESLPTTFRYAVEIRNRAWLAAPLLDLLRRHRTALVLADLANMPHPADLAADLDLITTDFAYVRLIGDRRAVEARTATFDRIVIDQSARLARWAGYLRALPSRAQQVFVFSNNHFAGHAPASIADLARRILDPDGGQGRV